MNTRLIFKANLLVFLFSLMSCKPYQEVYVRPHEFLEERNVQKNFKNYRIIIHDTLGDKLELIKPRIQGDSVYGDLTLPPKVDSTYIAQSENKNTVHIYLLDTLLDLKMEQQPFSIAKNDISKVRVYAKNERKLMFVLGMVLLTVLGVFVLAYGLLVLLVFASGAAAEESSAGSNSNSDSNSGDGGSSDGSNSNSGCFIATLAFDDYNAPSVVVLREFRDRYLLRFKRGRIFVKWYYKNSPHFVERYRESSVMKFVLRVLLAPIVIFCRICGRK